MDIADKHRELNIIASTGAFEIPIDLWGRYVDYQFGIPGSVKPDIAGEFKRDGKVIPQVAFSNFCGRKRSPSYRDCNSCTTPSLISPESSQSSSESTDVF